MNNDLRIALCRSITARAHLYGAEAAELEAEARTPPEDHPDPEPFVHHLKQPAAAARRRYWRELHHAALLSGWSWPEAEALGREVQ